MKIFHVSQNVERLKGDYFCSAFIVAEDKEDAKAVFEEMLERGEFIFSQDQDEIELIVEPERIGFEELGVANENQKRGCIHWCAGRDYDF